MGPNDASYLLFLIVRQFNANARRRTSDHLHQDRIEYIILPSYNTHKLEISCQRRTTNAHLDMLNWRNECSNS